MNPSIVIFGTMLIMAAIAAFNAKRKPSEPNRISPGKISAMIVIVFGLGLAGIGLFMLAWLLRQGANEGVGTSLGILALGLAMGGFMAPSLTHAHDVTWNRDHVEGPSHLFGLTLGWKRHRIAWRDIEKTGKTFTGYDYLETRDGRRIYWSFLYPGFRAFENTLRARSGLS